MSNPVNLLGVIKQTLVLRNVLQSVQAKFLQHTLEHIVIYLKVARDSFE